MDRMERMKEWIDGKDGKNGKDGKDRMYKKWMKDERCWKGCIKNEWRMKDIEKDV